MRQQGGGGLDGWWMTVVILGGVERERETDVQFKPGESVTCSGKSATKGQRTFIFASTITGVYDAYCTRSIYE